MQNWHFRKYSVIPSVVELLGGGNPLVGGCYVCESCQPIISTCQRRNVIPAQERHSSVGWNLFMGKWTPAYAGVTLFRWGDGCRKFVIPAKAGIHLIGRSKQTIIQIIPFRIHLLYNIDFPLSLPGFDGLFTLNGGYHFFVDFVPN